MFFIGLSIASVLPLRVIETAFFAAMDSVAPYHSAIAEAVDFAGAARGVLPYIGAVIFALCEEAYISALVMSPDSQWCGTRSRRLVYESVQSWGLAASARLKLDSRLCAAAMCCLRHLPRHAAPLDFSRCAGGFRPQWLRSSSSSSAGSFATRGSR